MNGYKEKAKSYHRYKITLSLTSLAVSCIYLALVQFTGMAFRLKALSTRPTDNPYLALAIYIVVLNLGYHLIALPVNFYSGFIVEHRFSLSNQGIASWFKDDIKRWLIATPIFLVLLEVFYATARCLHANWWVASSAIWIAFSILFTRLFPVIIIPIFYKCIPLANTVLRSKMLDLAKRFKIKIVDVFEIDFSKNTKKSNAAIVGLGKTKRIILADNLLNEFTQEEVEVVAAHEMAHHKLSHIWKLTALSALSVILFFFLLSRLAGPLAALLGAEGQLDIAIFPTILLLFIVYGVISAPIQNTVSRQMEKNADMLALKTTKLRDSFISLMKKLAIKNLADENPNRLVEILFYDHPPIGKRIELAKKFQQ